ncbi:MAG: dTDP-4-dehydrorhamnose reductase [Sulfitobacter sp.]
MILVFGKTGQLAQALGRHGHVQLLGRDQADLCDPAACAAWIEKTDARAIINAAAYTDVDGAESDAATAHQVNAVAPGAMARAAAARALPFVHVSTDYVFDGSGTAPWRETDRPAPATVYGQSKQAGEEAICAAAGPHAILRTAWVFSATGKNFLRTMLRLSQTHDALRVVNDQYGAPTPADDLARACLTVAQRLTLKNSGIYHFTGAPVTSWAGFAAEIFARAGTQIDITGIPSSHYPTPAPRPLNSALDCSKIAQVFGIPQPDWRRGIDLVLKDLS